MGTFGNYGLSLTLMVISSSLLVGVLVERINKVSESSILIEHTIKSYSDIFCGQHDCNNLVIHESTEPMLDFLDQNNWNNSFDYMPVKELSVHSQHYHDYLTENRKKKKKPKFAKYGCTTIRFFGCLFTILCNLIFGLVWSCISIFTSLVSWFWQGPKSSVSIIVYVKSFCL